jgi:hypothetical protein
LLDGRSSFWRCDFLLMLELSQPLNLAFLSGPNFLQGRHITPPQCGALYALVDYLIVDCHLARELLLAATQGFRECFCRGLFSYRIVRVLPLRPLASRKHKNIGLDSVDTLAGMARALNCAHHHACP